MMKIKQLKRVKVKRSQKGIALPEPFGVDIELTVCSADDTVARFVSDRLTVSIAGLDNHELKDG